MFFLEFEYDYAGYGPPYRAGYPDPYYGNGGGYYPYTGGDFYYDYPVKVARGGNRNAGNVSLGFQF